MTKKLETNKLSYFILFLLMKVLLVSCVGTIEDTQVKKTQAVPTNLSPIKFDGIALAKPVANDKVEIFFFPAPGDSKDLVYNINYDGLITPLSVPAINLRPDYRGYLSYTVLGLETNATYNFEVQVKDIKTTAVSNAKAQRSATTYANITANFLGIQNVKTMPGISGINSIKVQWAEAEKQGGAYTPKEIDPDRYEITVIDSDLLTPGDMFNQAYGEPARKVALAAKDRIETVIGGLQGDRTYHIAVRCIHAGYVVNGSNINYKRETNTKYLTVTTLKPGISNIDFDTESVVAQLSPGTSGLSSIVTSWAEASGAFDHYRVYYTKAPTNLYAHVPDAICNGSELNDPNVFCKKIDFDVTVATLVDLTHHTDYNVSVAVCQSLDCAVGQRILATVKTIKTTPNVAPFSGITSIDPAKSLNGVDYLHLNVQQPDLNAGIMDGIIVEFKDPYLGAIPLNYPNGLLPNTSALNVLSFNYQTVTEIIVTGVNPLSPDPYCFSAFPFIWDNGSVIEHREAETIKCIVPSINSPTLADFNGANGCNSAGSNSVTVDWNVPTKGVYSHFEVYIRDALGLFEFGVAIGGSGTYTKYLVDGSLTSLTIENLVPGNYRIGVLSYVNVYGVAVRSEFNTSYAACTADP